MCAPEPVRAHPGEVSDEAAAFTVLGAVALQGIRLADPTLGENVVVIGLGLLGLLTVQLLLANGCRVLGVDFDPHKVALARQFGAETVDLSAGGDPVAAGLAFSNGRGVDAVIVTASTKSSEPLHQAALMSRKRGRIVLVGVTGLELSRADFYEKELTFQVSCSYGPGRYDEHYEQRGHDYPIGFVRWTEQRNFEAVLDLLAAGQLDVGLLLIAHRYRSSRSVPHLRTAGGGRLALGHRVELSARRRSSIKSCTITRRRAGPGAAGGDIGFCRRSPRVAALGAGKMVPGLLRRRPPSAKSTGSATALSTACGGQLGARA